MRGQSFQLFKLQPHYTNTCARSTQSALTLLSPQQLLLSEVHGPDLPPEILAESP